MKNIGKIAFGIAFIFASYSASAKVSFKLLKEYTATPDDEKCGDLCAGSCTAAGNTAEIDWNLNIEIAPDAKQDEKDQIITNYKNCLTAGLPYLKEHYAEMKSMIIMIPRGLFLTSAEGTYNEKMKFSDPKKENKMNFENFVKIAQPIFDATFENLKVLVWQYNQPKKR